MTQATTLCDTHLVHGTSMSLAHEMVDLPLHYQMTLFFGLLSLVTSASLLPLDFSHKEQALFSNFTFSPKLLGKKMLDSPKGSFSPWSLQLSKHLAKE